MVLPTFSFDQSIVSTKRIGKGSSSEMVSLYRSGCSCHRQLFFPSTSSPLIITLLFLIFVMIGGEVSGWSTPSSRIHRPIMITTPPSSPNDWKQIASLLVTVFDKEGGETLMERFGWWFMEQLMTERDVMEQYWETSKKMKGNKYAVILAKENSKVVGMAELGVSRRGGISQDDDDDNDDVLVGATVGVLAVLPTHQGLGVGKLLLQKCEALAKCEAWNESLLYAEVEPSNGNALRFFREQGYVQEGRMVPVTVRRKRIYEERPHLLLYKNFTISDE